MTAGICIVIVNYNSGHLLCRCLDSIKAQNRDDCRVIVVDNNSADDSLQCLSSGYAEVDCIVNRQNLGFAVANNQAVSGSDEDLLFFLNPDTEVKPGCLDAIEEFMATHPDVGLAAPALLNIDGTPHSSHEYMYPGGRYAPELFQNLPGDIAWLLGAALVVRRDVFCAVGGFDTRFFLYAEDIDLCLEVRKKGWPLALIPGAEVMHIEGQSEKGAPYAEVMERKIRAEILFLKKHYPPAIVRKICFVRLLESWWQIACLQVLAKVIGLTAENKDKLSRYRVVSGLYRQLEDGQ